MSASIVPILVTINNGDAGVGYAIVPSYGGDYAAGDDGSVWSCVRIGHSPRTRTDRWRKLKTYRAGRYFLATILCGGKHRPFPVHRLVLEAWHGPPPADRTQTRHLNDNGFDNRPTNLAWGTHGENMRDRGINDEPTFRGNEHPMAVLTEELVIAMRKAVADGSTVAAVAISLGLQDHLEAAYSAVSGGHWKHVPGAVPGYKKISKDDKLRIKQLFSEGRSVAQIMADTGHDYHTVYNVAKRNATLR